MDRWTGDKWADGQRDSKRRERRKFPMSNPVPVREERTTGRTVKRQVAEDFVSCRFCENHSKRWECRTINNKRKGHAWKRYQKYILFKEQIPISRPAAQCLGAYPVEGSASTRDYNGEPEPGLIPHVFIHNPQQLHEGGVPSVPLSADEKSDPREVKSSNWFSRLQRVRTGAHVFNHCTNVLCVFLCLTHLFLPWNNI